MGITTDLIYIILAALVGGFVAQLLRQPLAIGYILAGVLVGPYTAGPTVQRIDDIEMLAEIGVALLLFTLGLEFSFKELKRFAKIAAFGTPLQIVLCTFSTYAISRYLGYSASDAIWMGATVSLSSTMVVLKTLTAQGGLESLSGRIMLTILIAQDLAVIPLMLLVPQLTGDTIDWPVIGTALVKSLAFITSMLLIGTWVFPLLFRIINRLQCRELFFLTTLSVALGAGYASHELGLSFALGAFIAGMLMSETEYQYQALSDVAGLRDLFSLLFFVSVGMLVDPTFFVDNRRTVVGITLGVLVCKTIILTFVVRLCGAAKTNAWAIGLGLSQVGEFAFVVANAGHQAGQLTDNSYSLMIAVAVLSMVVTPMLFLLARRLFPSHA
jgi:CPA2 family monovalent cation:H+ antiporter-2